MQPVLGLRVLVPALLLSLPAVVLPAADDGRPPPRADAAEGPRDSVAAPAAVDDSPVPAAAAAVEAEVDEPEVSPSRPRPRRRQRSKHDHHHHHHHHQQQQQQQHGSTVSDGIQRAIGC